MKDGKIADYLYSVEAFTSEPECEKAAPHYEANYKVAESRAEFKCLPDTVDPRGTKGK